MKQTIIDQIQITRNGHLQIRMMKQIVDGDDVIDIGFHTTAIEVGGDVKTQMQLVNAHLVQMGFTGVDINKINEVIAISEIVFTPERIAKHEAQRATLIEADPQTDDNSTKTSKV